LMEFTFQVAIRMVRPWFWAAAPCRKTGAAERPAAPHPCAGNAHGATIIVAAGRINFV
jgi:hypothetical protein